MYVEELGTFPSASPVLRLMATLRSGEGVPCGFRATGNPGGPGHQWVKARYIDPNPGGWEVRKFTYENPWTRDTIEQDRVFIPSKLQDNKFLGPEYVANLQMVGSDTLVRAWLEGDWTVIEGAYFDCWRYDLHVVEPFEVPAHWGRPLDGLGLGQALLGGMVGNSGRRSLPVRPRGVTDHPPRRSAPLS